MRLARSCFLLVYIATIAAASLLILPKLPSHAQSCDFPLDASSQVNSGNCGNTEWDLVAEVGGNYYDEGYWWAYGACAGNYFECGTYVPSQTYYGDESFEPTDPDPVNDGWHFYWLLDDWVVQNQNITCRGGSQSAAQTVIDYPYSTPTFWGWCNYE